jgi:hypothetical protein
MYELMNSHRSIKLRMIADFVLVFAFGFVAPLILAPISKNWTVMLIAFATFLIAIGSLWDGLRTMQRLRNF